MKIRFANNKLARQLSDATSIKQAFGVMAKKVSMRMDDIQAAPNLAVLRKLPQANCHPLKGNRTGEWAVDISGNHRLIFRIDQDPIPMKEDGTIEEILVTDIVIIETADYH